MTDPVEEQVEEQEQEQEFTRAPLDDAHEDVGYTAKTLEHGDIEDMETPSEEEVLEGVSNDDDDQVEEEKEEVDDEAEGQPAEEEPAPETAEETQEEQAPSLHKVKINGEEYDLSTDDLISGYQQAAASQQKFQQASEVEKAARSVIDNVLDPEKSVETMIDLYSDKLDGDREKAAEVVDEIIGKRIQHLIDLEEMSDEQRQIHEMTADKERMETQLAATRAAEEQQRQAEYIKYQNTQAVPLLDSAITKYNLDVGSAEDVESSQILAEYIRQGHTITQELADSAVADVVNRRRELLQSTLSGMSAEALATANPDLANQVQKRNVEEIKASRATNTEANQGSTSKRRRKAKADTEYKDSNDFFNTTDF